MNYIKLITPSILLLNIPIYAYNTGFEAMDGDKNQRVVDKKYDNKIDEIESKLNDFYQKDRIYEENNSNEQTDWIPVGAARNCGNWYKTVTDERRECLIDQAQINKDTTQQTANTTSLLSEMNVDFNTREDVYIDTRELPEILVSLVVNPKGASSPDYRADEDFEVKWSATGVDRCDANIVAGADNGFDGNELLTAVNNTNGYVTQTIKVGCFTPAESIENPPLNTKIETIRIKPRLPEVELTSPAMVYVGNSFTIGWTSNYAVSCSGKFETNVNPLALNGGRNITFNTPGTKVLEVSCENGIGEEIKSIKTVNVIVDNTSILFTVNPTDVFTGENINASWSTQNMSSCNADWMAGNNNGVDRNTTFRYNTPGLKTLTLTCTDAAGLQKRESRQVTVRERDPEVTVTAPATVRGGVPFNVSWTSTGAVTCDAMFIASGNNGINGTKQMTITKPGIRTFQVYCRNASGVQKMGSATTTITDVLPMVSVTGPGTVNVNQLFSINWTSTDAVECDAFFESGLSNGPSGSKNFSYPTTGKRNFGVSCRSITGATQMASTDVTVVNVVPTLNFTVNPSSMNVGDSARMVWSSINASSCTNNFGGPSAITGDFSKRYNVRGDYTLTVTCTSVTGAKVTVNRNLSVTVPAIPLPFVTLSSSPSEVPIGTESTLIWTSNNADSCTGTGFNPTVVNGNKKVTVNSNTTYTITCTNAAGSRSANTQVTVYTPESPNIPTRGEGFSCFEGTCVKVENSKLYISGNGREGQLAQNSIEKTVQGKVSSPFNWSQIRALKDTGQSWVGNWTYQNGITKWLAVEDPASSGSVKKAWVAARAVYVLLNNGSVMATGDTEEGQMGQPNLLDCGFWQTVASFVRTTNGCFVPLSLSNIRDVIGLEDTVYFVDSNGSLWHTDPNKDNENATRIDTGINNVVAFLNVDNGVSYKKSDGKIYNYGGNNYGYQLKGFTPTGHPNEYVLDRTDVSHYVSSNNGAAAIIGGVVYTIGYNTQGQLGPTNMSEMTDWYNTGQGASNIMMEDDKIIVSKSDGIYYMGKYNKGYFKNFKSLTNPTMHVTENKDGKKNLFVESSTGIWVCGDNTYGELTTGNKSLQSCPSFRKVQSNDTMSWY